MFARQGLNTEIVHVNNQTSDVPTDLYSTVQKLCKKLHTQGGSRVTQRCVPVRSEADLGPVIKNVSELCKIYILGCKFHCISKYHRMLVETYVKIYKYDIISQLSLWWFFLYAEIEEDNIDIAHLEN